MRVVIVQPSEAFQAIWIGWVGSWVAASLWSGRTEKRAVTRETWIYRIVIFAGAILIAPWTAQVLGERPTWQAGYYGACALVSVILMGLALTWWARIHLGCLWSSAITRKEKHRLIESGPYAFVRHPIYTGMLLAAMGTALVIGEWRGVVAVFVILAAHSHKALREEALLTTELGEEYTSYRRSTGFLFPRFWRSAGTDGMDTYAGRS